MSVSASLADLGSIASSRATQPPALRSSRTVSGQDDAFGQMLRDAAKEKPEAPARDANRLAARPRAEEARAEDRPAREKPEAPAAAVEHRSENARQGSGPRDPDEVRSNDGPTDRDRSACGPAADSQGSAEDAAGVDKMPRDAKPAQPVAETTETPAEQPVTTVDQTTVDQTTVDQTTTAEAIQLVAAGPSTETAKPSADPAAPVEATSPQEPGTAAPGQATTAQVPQTVLPAAPAVLPAGQASTPARRQRPRSRKRRPSRRQPQSRPPSPARRSCRRRASQSRSPEPRTGRSCRKRRPTPSPRPASSSRRSSLARMETRWAMRGMPARPSRRPPRHRARQPRRRASRQRPSWTPCAPPWPITSRSRTPLQRPALSRPPPRLP